MVNFFKAFNKNSLFYKRIEITFNELSTEIRQENDYEISEIIIRSMIAN